LRFVAFLFPVAVTHDRFFLENLTQWILSIENGRGTPYEGCYSTYLEARARALAEKEKQESSVRRQINAELDWIRASPKARQSKAKARITRFDELVEEQQRFSNSKAGVLDRIYIPPGPPLGGIVVDAENVVKNYGDRALYKGLTFSIPRGGIVGVIGPNGAGKSTLLRMIVGEEKPDGGEFKVGETVKIMYASQDRDALDMDKTVFEAISGGSDEMILGGRTVKSRAYLGWFNFRGAAQQKKVSDLSGGELSRLNLARVTSSGGNLLLLDEVTNDADTEYIMAIEQAVLDFGGSVICVSHDRAFLDHICTHILAFDEEGGSTFFYGNFAAYEEDRRKRLGGAATPSRMKFRALPTL
jgi:energy-dependent translational throttle protein EttA